MNLGAWGSVFRFWFNLGLRGTRYVVLHGIVGFVWLYRLLQGLGRAALWEKIVFNVVLEPCAGHEL